MQVNRVVTSPVIAGESAASGSGTSGSSTNTSTSSSNSSRDSRKSSRLDRGAVEGRGYITMDGWVFTAVAPVLVAAAATTTRLSMTIPIFGNNSNYD